MKKHIIIFLMFFPLIAFANQTILVVGTGDADTDRAAIIQALEDVEENGTILLQGHFQIGKFVPGTPNPIPKQPFIHITKSNITITGERTGGTWNTVLTGLLNPNGTIPTTDPSIPGGGLLGLFQIGPSTGILKNITIKDLKIEHMSRAIFIGPDVDVTSGACSDTLVTTGSGQNISVKDVWFEHTARAVQAFGNIHQINLENNIVRNNQRETFYVQGFGTACTGAFPFFYMPTPSHVNVVGNLFQNDTITAGTSALGVRIYYADNVKVENNTFDKGARSAPLAMAGVTNSQVSDNHFFGSLGTVTATQFGIEVGDNLGRDPNGNHPSTQALEIKKNHIEDIGFPASPANVGFAVYIDINTTGTVIKNNMYTNNKGDVLLSGATSSIPGVGGPFVPSFENTVMEDAGTVIVDNGVNNTVK